MSRPEINVTPLIDVLLVLLIIFMVISPLKPARFQVRIPAEAKTLHKNVDTHPLALVVDIDQNQSLRLNKSKGFGTVVDPAALVYELRRIFSERKANGAYSDQPQENIEENEGDRVERTVFIKAPKGIGYGNVAKVVDAAKLAGAVPIGLQIDHLD
ncbi:MAG: biopolymer transporter ExbD [Pyrinomonadaceae bacterium]